MSLVVLLNLAVFDEVMLCRRWISWVSLSSGGWSEQVQEEYLSEYGLSQSHKAEFERLKYLAGIDLIRQRTETVNRLIRYPFIALLIMIAARNDYFDIWNYPLVLLLAWALNVVLALSGALLLYQIRRPGRSRECLVGLSKQMIQALGSARTTKSVRNKSSTSLTRSRPTRRARSFHSTNNLSLNPRFYGLVALLQYLYMR